MGLWFRKDPRFFQSFEGIGGVVGCYAKALQVPKRAGTVRSHEESGGCGFEVNISINITNLSLLCIGFALCFRLEVQVRATG